MAYIQRAFRDARKSLVTPKPAVFTPTLSRLRTTKEQQSAQIDARIRPKRPSLPASLPPAADAEVDALLRKRGVISKCEREQVSDKDLARLRPGQWLNDEVINFYGQMIMCRAEEGKENRREGLWDAHYFSTFFWSKLKNEGYEKGRLAKWTKKVRRAFVRSGSGSDVWRHPKVRPVLKRHHPHSGEPQQLALDECGDQLQEEEDRVIR